MSTATKRSVKRQILERDNWRCRYCGRQVVIPTDPKKQAVSNAATLDHLIPRSRGGTRTLANSVTACWTCNHDKSSLTLHEFLFGNQRKWRHLNTHPSRHHHVAKASRRLHARIRTLGTEKYAMKDLHLALLAESQLIKQAA